MNELIERGGPLRSLEQKWRATRASAEGSRIEAPKTPSGVSEFWEGVSPPQPTRGSEGALPVGSGEMHFGRIFCSYRTRLAVTSGPKLTLFWDDAVFRIQAFRGPHVDVHPC